MNDDFRKTGSYTPKIAQFAKYYRTYSNIVIFSTIADKLKLLISTDAELREG